VDARLRTLLELRALEALGLCPELRRCVRCGEDVGVRAGDVRFRVADGGPVCASCAPAAEGLLPVQLGTLRSLEQGLHFELDHLHRLVLSPEILAEARGLVTRFQRFHVGVELRSERFLDEVLSSAGFCAT
jgi:DNA repair protein RecO (recombination protein O)